MWKCLKLKSGVNKAIDSGFESQTVHSMIQDMHEGSTTHVRCMNGCSEPFAVTVRVHQKSALSSFLFAILMDFLIKKSEERYLRK